MFYRNWWYTCWWNRFYQYHSAYVQFDWIQWQLFGYFRSLLCFKRDEIVDNANVANDDIPHSFKYKANLIGNTETDGTKKV